MKNDDNTKLTEIFTAIKNDDTESQHGGGPFSFLKKVVDIFYCGVKFFVSRALKHRCPAGGADGVVVVVGQPGNL